MSDIPPGWAAASFADLGETRLGKMLDKTKNTGLPVKYLRNINVRWFRMDLSDLQTILLSKDELTALSIRDGDLLICEGGEPGRAAVWRNGPNNLTFQKALHRMRVAPGIVPELLMYRLRADAESGKLREAFTGTTIKHLTGESLARYRTSIPPSPEQIRLVKTISILIGRTDACRERLNRIPTILSKFREAVLEAAVSGRLTEEWRVERGASAEYANGLADLDDAFSEFTYPATWTRARLADIAEVVGGITKDSKRQSVGEAIPYLRVANVQRGRLNLTEIKTIRVPKDRIQALLLRRGDILFNEGGDRDKLGRGCVWHGEIERCIFQNHVFRVRLRDTQSKPEFFSHFGNGPAIRYFLLRGTQTTNLASISRRVLAALPIPIPAPDEQHEIARRVDELIALADSLERQYQTAVARVEKLTPSVLAKAFRGQLVPQDPNDEPAERLLERLGASREVQMRVTKKRGRKVTTTGASAFTGQTPAEEIALQRSLVTLLRKGARVQPEALLQASGLDIDEFYDQLQTDVAAGRIREVRSGKGTEKRWLELTK